MRFAFAVALLCGLAATTVAAQSLDPQHFKPTPDAAALFTVDTAEIRPSGAVDVGTVFNYGQDLLVLRNVDTLARAGSFVSQRLDANLLASVGVLGFLELGIDVPLIGLQSGATGLGMLPEQSSQQLSSAGIGDVRLMVKARLLREDLHGISLAVLPVLTAPTGRELNGAGGFGFLPEVVVSRRLGALRFAANLGVRLQPTSQLNELTVGNELVWRAGGGLDFAELGTGVPVEVLLEAYGQTALAEPFKRAQQSPVEALLGARYNLGNGLGLQAGAGRGLSMGYGAPAWRAFAGLSYSVGRGAGVSAPADRDADGVVDGEDACPDEAGPFERQGCPIRDRDNDGVEDADDACPDEPGPPDRKGCPVRDRDNDGVEDADDACPDEAGPADRKGCPFRDRDGDGVEDALDACPDQAGPAERQGCPLPDTDTDGVPDHLDNCPKVAGPASNQGCPETKKQLVVITATQLEIKQKVYFATGKATILRQSFELLDQVADVINAQPQLCPVRVEGHTDSSGRAALNLKLSQARADSVRRYLIQRGVAPDCLKATGYGPNRPIGDNGTAEGRETNRRVEFGIGEAARQ